MNFCWSFTPLRIDFEQLTVTFQLKFRLCILVGHINGVRECRCIALIGDFLKLPGHQITQKDVADSLD